VFRRIARQLLLLFMVVYMPSRTHVVTDVLSKLLSNSKPLGVINQVMDASLFYVEPIWM
jgi:hypothetical protein